MWRSVRPPVVAPFSIALWVVPCALLLCSALAFHLLALPGTRQAHTHPPPPGPRLGLGRTAQGLRVACPVADLRTSLETSPQRGLSGPLLPLPSLLYFLYHLFPSDVSF